MGKANVWTAFLAGINSLRRNWLQYLFSSHLSLHNRITCSAVASSFKSLVFCNNCLITATERLFISWWSCTDPLMCSLNYSCLRYLVLFFFFNQWLWDSWASLQNIRVIVDGSGWLLSAILPTWRSHKLLLHPYGCNWIGIRQNLPGKPCVSQQIMLSTAAGHVTGHHFSATVTSTWEWFIRVRASLLQSPEQSTGGCSAFMQPEKHHQGSHA